jgi:asparagine synthase (glutamine-hydrolysing)
LSGIVGIINTDGAPVDRGLLRRLTESMARRGPDAREVWADGPVGFGHAMLRTTREAEGETQPRGLGGNLWVTADARIDGRAELIRELEAAGFGGLKKAPDADLLLGAYAAWGEDCVGHLLGDFSFAIWDSARRRLFCARDHFGVRPFYYASLKNCFVFSNTLDCLRLHPAVSSELNERALGDFLLFDFNYDLATTVFADIRRLPPAHRLTWTEGEPRAARYWSLPTEGRVRYRKRGEYVERFKELLSAAVDDRLRTERVGVLMSGGLDSTALAATARELLSRAGRPFDLQAYTITYERLIKYDEDYYARLTAEALGIPLNLLVADDYKLLERCFQPETRKPEPIVNPLMATNDDQYAQLAANSRVVLAGQGPDTVLSTHFPQHVSSLYQQGYLMRALADVGRYAFWQRKLPPVGVRTLLRRYLGRELPPPEPPFPPWLNPDFVARENLAERFRQLNAAPEPVHATNPVGHNRLASPFWAYLFERDNLDGSRFGLEIRYPFFDVRLVSYMLAIPTARWCVDKRLLRLALRGSLPESVRLRPKTPMSGDVFQARVDRGERPWVGKLDVSPPLTKYIRVTDRQELERYGADDFWFNLRLVWLNDWVQQTLENRSG